jgi:hypothetical protein
LGEKERNWNKKANLGQAKMGIGIGNIINPIILRAFKKEVKRIYKFLLGHFNSKSTFFECFLNDGIKFGSFIVFNYLGHYLFAQV